MVTPAPRGVGETRREAEQPPTPDGLMMDEAEQPPSEPGRPSSGSAGPILHLDDPQGRLDDRQSLWLREQGERALALAARGGELRVKIVGDEDMAAAHTKYSGVAGTTDVLTFDLGSESTERGVVLDADVLVCADVALRSAAERDHEPERELLLYVLHAALHCAGHNDTSDEAFDRMHAEEDRILEAIGVGVTFRVPADDSLTGASR